MENFFGDIRNQLRERIASPLLGSFVIAWFIWNYKVPLILLSEEPVLAKLSLLKDFAFPCIYDIATFGFAFPLASALAYIYLYPIPASRVYQYALLKQREMAELRQKIEDDTPLTREEYTKIRASISIERANIQNLIDQKDREIERLKEEVSELAKRVSEPPIRPITPELKTSPKTAPELPRGQDEILHLIAGKGGFATAGEIAGSDKSKYIEIDYNIGELERLKYISNTERRGEYGYALTHAGKGYIVRSRKEPNEEREE